MGVVEAGIVEGLNEFFGCGEWRVRRIGGEVTEEGLAFTLFNEGHGFVKEYVFAIAFGFHPFAVTDEEGVEVIKGTTDIGRAPVEPTFFRTGLVTEVPFPNKPGLVPSGFQ